MPVVRSFVLAAFVAVAGCAEPAVLRPLEPIVLRPANSEDQALHRVPPHARLSATRPERGRTLVQSRPAPASHLIAAERSEELASPEPRSESGAVRTDNLSPERKESLFRDFDEYLRRPGSHQSDELPGVAPARRPASSTAGVAASAALVPQDHPAPGNPARDADSRAGSLAEPAEPARASSR
jgi:hypothetical protein